MTSCNERFPFPNASPRGTLAHRKYNRSKRAFKIGLVDASVSVMQFASSTHPASKQRHALHGASTSNHSLSASSWQQGLVRITIRRRRSANCHQQFSHGFWGYLVENGRGSRRVWIYTHHRNRAKANDYANRCTIVPLLTIDYAQKKLPRTVYAVADGMMK